MDPESGFSPLGPGPTKPVLRATEPMTARRTRAAATGSVSGCLAWFLILSATVSPAKGQLLFLMEPPPRLTFSNSSGARVSCAAHGNPPPVISWMTEDGSPVTEIPGLRGALPNGTLWIGAFSPMQYRSDVHSSLYRCRAANTVGTVLSRDMRVEAVMDVEWGVSVESSHALAGGAAVLSCAVPSVVRGFVSVTRWYKDGTALMTMPIDSGGRHMVGGSKGDLLLLKNVKSEDVSAYSCEAQHELTGEKKRSSPSSVIVSQPSGNMPPRLVTGSSDEVVSQGADIRLVCCATGYPTPSYSWYQVSGGRLVPVSTTIRISVMEQVLVIRRVQMSDAGVWSCRTHNPHGEQRKDIRLTVLARLSVNIQPQLQVANSGSTVAFNCSVGDESIEGVRVRWLHDGVPVGGGERVMRIHGVARAHRGMYQCFAEKDRDNAQAAAELRLGDTAPELHYTFIEQALHPGPPLDLHCAASGSPSPRFTWLLDGQPIEEHNAPQRVISQFMSSNGDVISYLNMTSVRVEDGGRYTCRAHNSRGSVEHSARLNVYGPPSIRSTGAIRVVAALNTTIFCPYSGFPISEIRWQRDGVDVGSSSDRTAAGSAGELLLWPAEPADAGVYSCRVTAPSGQYAQKDIQIIVRNPPKIAGFMFPNDLVEGSSIQVLCGITSGDKPVYFSWLKDRQTIPNSLQVQEKSLEDFSFLIFPHLTSKHTGEYTCVASNGAAEVNHTATLAVKVAPSWLYEPQDVSALLGAQIILNCATKGYPEPKITWLRAHGPSPSDFRPVSNMDFQYSILPNGSLTITPAARQHEGQYMCRAENNVGRGLSKTVRVSVNEPAHFEYSSRNLTTKRTNAITLQCDALGDAPMTIQWTHDMKRLDLSTYRLSISEVRTDSGVRSQLSIAHAERQDSGVYRCRAENTFGRDELLIYLAVQEFPEAPQGLHVSWHGARAAKLSWRRGYDGNARVRNFRLQYRVVGNNGATGDDWRNAPVRDVPIEHIVERYDSGTRSATILEYRIDGLRPASAYAVRLAAVNAIGDSAYSDSVIVKTLEEAPSEAPHSVHVQATAPGELLVKWKAPPQESWNGELLGYVITWREVVSVDNASRSLTTPGWGASEVLISGLKTHAHYDVRVRAFNAVGAGPASASITATTLEGVPEAAPQRIRCEPLSAMSIRVWWDPPPSELRGGVLLGYEVLFEVADPGEAPRSESRRSGGLETILQSLQRATNYTISVRARTAAGAGPTSEAVSCATHEDVPGPPADIKALAKTEDTILVSWLSPKQKNGKIKHYNIYYRPAGRIGQHSQHTVIHNDGDEEYTMDVRGLQEHQLYEFWITAATNSGEGELSAIIARKPNSRAVARVASFGRRVHVAAGTTLRLRCYTAGTPEPVRTWKRSRPSAPLSSDPRLVTDGSDLVINNLDRHLSDNYTCSVENLWGKDSATWEVKALFPPGKTELRLTSATSTRLLVSWETPPDGGSLIHGYTLEYTKESIIVWSTVRLPGDSRSHSIDNLSCGTRYRLRIKAYNAVGASENSPELILSTKGGLSKASADKDLVTTNSSCVKLNLLTWESNGCPVSEFMISVRQFEEQSWRSVRTVLASDPFALCGLRPGSWHHLRVAAMSSAGTTKASYYFATLTDTGAKVAAPAVFPSPDGETSTASVVLGAIGAVVFVLAMCFLALIVWRRIIHPSACMAKGYHQGDISEDEDKTLEKRDNHRNCQQVYTSSPIKVPAKKEQQEMYEISPYATFSMGAGGGAGPGAVSLKEGDTVQFRTFGRADEAALAAPARPKLDKHRSFNKPDEYTLSRAMTMMVRREDSDTDSSGSPCTECNSNPSYRLPVGTPKGDVFRPITDSSAESQLEGSGAARAQDKARRRARSRHHTPTTHRYQQRQEQERRDFTIHV